MHSDKSLKKFFFRMENYMDAVRVMIRDPLLRGLTHLIRYVEKKSHFRST